MTKPKEKVLFICTHNSARSQMAEGLLRHLAGGRYEVYSAGSQPSQVHPMAVRVMAEINIDISKQRSKSIKEFSGKDFDYVVTVCDNVRETCPVFPGGKKQLHSRLGRDSLPAGRHGTVVAQSFADPSDVGSEQMTAAFRRVRDEIKEWIEKTFLKEL